MRILQPVVWSKGTFLNAQHLQAQDRYFESVLQFRVEALHFRPWGFSALLLDQAALDKGLFRLHEARGLMPDGLAFDIPTSDPAPAARPLAQFFAPEQTSLLVYLALPSYREGGVNLSVEEKGIDTRYLAEVVTLRDENTGSTEKPIQMARKNLRLLFEGEPRRGAVALPVARVLRSAEDVYSLDADFVPPLLSFGVSPLLTSIARRLLEILSARGMMLAGLRRQKNQSLADFTTGDIANFWLLYTINTHFPALRHLFETKLAHPEELYRLLLGFASSLTTFSMETQPHDLPLYDHENLGPVMIELDEKLRRLLETVVPSNFVSLPMKLIRPSVYASSIFEDRLLDRTRLYLAIRADVGEAELIRKAPQLIKVCSATHIEHLIRQALPGVPLLHVPQPPATLPVKLNHQYFSLSRSGVAWEAVERARNIAAYVPAELPNPEVELIVLLPE
jgi:type VI secretion system protein ImpJ